jgi:hypothetical protein
MAGVAVAEDGPPGDEAEDVEDVDEDTWRIG